MKEPYKGDAQKCSSIGANMLYSDFLGKVCKDEGNVSGDSGGRGKTRM